MSEGCDHNIPIEVLETNFGDKNDVIKMTYNRFKRCQNCGVKLTLEIWFKTKIVKEEK